MIKSHWKKKAPSHSERLSLTEEQSDNWERSETIDITKMNPWGDVTSENLQWWVTHNSENTCNLMLKALNQWKSHRAWAQELKDQNNQKDSQIEKLLNKKWGLKQNVLKMTRHLNNLNSECSREGTLKSNVSDALKKCSVKFSDSSILDDDLKSMFWVWNNQMKSKLQINDNWFDQSDSDKAEHMKVTYIKICVDSKVTEHLYLWLKAQSEREIYIEKVIQCLKNVFEDSDWCLKAYEQLKKLRMPYLRDFNMFQLEFLWLMNSAKMSADQWKKEIHNKLYDSLWVQIKIYIADEDMSFNVYCKKV